MNRTLLLICVFLFCRAVAMPQESNQYSLESLRSLNPDLNLPNANNVIKLCNWNDSLAKGNMQWRAPYDSLMQDSLSLVQMERELVRMDAALVQYFLNPTILNYFKVKAQFSMSKGPIDSMSAYTKELHAILRELAVEYSDYPLAYSLQNRLHAIEFSEWMEADRLQAAEFDSLQQVIEKVENNSMEELVFSRNQTMQWHIIAVIGIGAVIILISLLLIFRLRWKRQIIQLTDKVNDKSEEETLVQKLEQARREISELRVVAKKKVEPALSDAISPLPAGASVSATEIAQWNDQIQQALVKIKSHCEAGKSTMGVPTYMSILNDTGRLSSLVQQKSEELIALLNAKKDTK